VEGEKYIFYGEGKLISHSFKVLISAPKHLNNTDAVHYWQNEKRKLCEFSNWWYQQCDLEILQSLAESCWLCGKTVHYLLTFIWNYFGERTHTNNNIRYFYSRFLFKRTKPGAILSLCINAVPWQFMPFLVYFSHDGVNTRTKWILCVNYNINITNIIISIINSQAFFGGVWLTWCKISHKFRDPSKIHKKSTQSIFKRESVW